MKYVPVDSVQLVLSGSNYFSAAADIIKSAKRCIHLHTYIYADDHSGNTIRELLIEAAARGVEIYVLADAFGSKELSGEFIASFHKAGIKFRLFSPLFSGESVILLRRLHHKILVADDKVALVGGINIADKYHGSRNTPSWLDYAVKIEGDACLYLSELCWNVYFKRRFKEQRVTSLLKGASQSELQICFRRNDWLRGKDEIHTSLRKAIYNSKKSVILIASYFLPGYLFRKAIRSASRRGVEVSILLAGLSDSSLTRYAEMHLYDFLLKNKVHIYEWPESVMHGKAMVVDQEWATVGSYNLNYLSRYGSIELNVDINSKEFAGKFGDHLRKNVLPKCKRISEENTPTRNFWVRVRNYLAYSFFFLIRKLFISRSS